MAERFTAGGEVWRGLSRGGNDKFLQLVFLFFTSLFNQAVKIHVHPVCGRRYQAAFPHPLHYFLPPIGPKVFGMSLRQWDFVFVELCQSVWCFRSHSIRAWRLVLCVIFDLLLIKIAVDNSVGVCASFRVFSIPWQSSCLFVKFDVISRFTEPWGGTV